MKSIKSRRIFTLLFIFILFIFTVIPVSASVSIPALQSSIYVYDDAGILDSDTESQTNTILAELKVKTGAQVFVITIPSLNGSTIAEYANELFNTIGIGDKERNDGVLLLISSVDSRVRLEIGVGLEDVLTDSLSGRILDDYFVPYRTDGNYDSAVILTASAVANTIAADHDVTLSNTYNTNISADTESESHPATKSDIALIILFFVAFIVISLFPFITIIFIAVMIFRSAKNQNTDSSQNPIIESSRNGKVFIRLGNSVTDISNDDSYAIRTWVPNHEFRSLYGTGGSSGSSGGSGHSSSHSSTSSHSSSSGGGGGRSGGGGASR